MKVTNLFTQADREVFDRIDRDCIAMHVVPPPKTFLKLEVRDGAGELTDVYEDRAHSWVRNAYVNLLQRVTTISSAYFGATYGEGKMAYKSTDGTVSSHAGQNMGFWNQFQGFSTIANDTERGIVVGTSDSAESFDSFSLGAMVAAGTSSGQLAYGVQSGPSGNYDYGTKKYTVTHSRIMNNNSGGAIVIREVGMHHKDAFVNKPHLLIRDLLSTAVTVPNAGQLTVTYTMEMIFPA